MTSKIMNKIQKKQNPNDVIYTPNSIVDLMLEFCDYKEGQSVLDPSKGKGAFFDKLSEPKDYCEITEGIDFFNYTKKVDLIVGNPPYSMLTKWLDHTMTICDKFCYIIGMYSLTPVRLQKMEEQGFHITKILLTQVPSWFMRSYILVVEKCEKRPITFDYKNIGNKCLYCERPCGGIKNVGHCKRKATDTECSY
jgi:hypothetical protein